MERRHERVARLLAAVGPWAASRDDVTAAALAGSWAAARARPDSDVDLLVLTSRRAALAEDHAWATDLLGEASLVRAQDWGPWLSEVRLALPDGLEVEVGLVEPAWAGTDPVDPGTARVVGDGWVVLHDPTGTFTRLAAAVTARPAADVAVDEALVRGLLAAQHPDLAARPLERAGGGWDNEMWRLGDDLAVRLPRRAAAAPLAAHEHRWLPVLARLTSLAVPVPLRVGVAADGYPYTWSVVPWLPGVPAWRTPVADRDAWAPTLADALADLHAPADPAAPVNPVRGVPLAERDEAVRQRLVPPGVPGADHLRALWADALDADPWAGPPVWLHGDPHPANLLVDRGRLVGLADFGDLTAGDPATDLATAWLTFGPAGRAAFRERLVARGALDDATWRRARGWAVVMATAMLRRPSDDAIATIGGHALAELRAEPAPTA